MFAYNENKQAYIKDPRAGTFASWCGGREVPGRPSTRARR
jgi:hypothetical protein